jgi:hypothetical protein
MLRIIRQIHTSSSSVSKRWLVLNAVDNEDGNCCFPPPERSDDETARTSQPA